MRRRNKLRKLANESASKEAWRNYRTLRNKVTLNLRQGKRAYFESLVSKSSTTTQDVWKQLNRLLGRNREARSAVNLEHGDNIASRLSDHFSGSALLYSLQTYPLPSHNTPAPSISTVSLKRTFFVHCPSLIPPRQQVPMHLAPGYSGLPLQQSAAVYASCSTTV